MAYADDYFDYNGYGYGSNYDGVLLLISMENRDWHISTCGFGITAFSDRALDYIGEEMLSSLSCADYYEAFCTYYENCDYFLAAARNGNPVSPNEPVDIINSGKTILFILGFGLFIGWFSVSRMKAQLKTIRYNDSASNYVMLNKTRITDRTDNFLYKNVSKTRINNSSSSGGSSTHRSSSGRSHGGRGGRF
jgi:uncharacterized protein